MLYLDLKQIISYIELSVSKIIIFWNGCYYIYLGDHFHYVGIRFLICEWYRDTVF